MVICTVHFTGSGVSSGLAAGVLKESSADAVLRGLAVSSSSGSSGSSGSSVSAVLAGVLTGGSTAGAAAVRDGGSVWFSQASQSSSSVSSESCSSSFTIMPHFRVFRPTFALITVLPALFPFTSPLLLTVATFFLLLDHFTFFLPAFFTFSFLVLPTLMVAFLQFNLGAFPAKTVDGIGTPVISIAITSSQAAIFNTFRFLLISTPHFLILLP